MMTEKVQAVPKRPTKLPARTVICSDFEVVIGGKRYWPHAGQRLVISGQGSIDDVMLSMGLASLKALADLTPEDARDAKETLELMLARSAEAIESWTWTDNNGKAYPPPTVDVLRRLSPDEIAYINEKVISGGEKMDAAKNGSSPSTSRSTRRRAGKRRQSG